MSTLTFHMQNPSVFPVLIGLTTLSHMLNGYERCLNTTKSVIFNMQGDRPQDFYSWKCYIKYTVTLYVTTKY